MIFRAQGADGRSYRVSLRLSSGFLVSWMSSLWDKLRTSQSADAAAHQLQGSFSFQQITQPTTPRTPFIASSPRQMPGAITSFNAPSTRPGDSAVGRLRPANHHPGRCLLRVAKAGMYLGLDADVCNACVWLELCRLEHGRYRRGCTVKVLSRQSAAGGACPKGGV